MIFRKFLIFFLIFFSQKIFSQNFSWKQIDSLTYQQFLNKDWKNLVKTAKEAEKNNIDFFYLTIRKAVANFYLENYSEAISLFEKSLQENPNDEYSLEYLYFAYVYAGKTANAQLLSKKISHLQKKHRLNSVSYEGGFSTTFNFNKLKNQKINSPYGQFAKQNVTENCFYHSLNFDEQFFYRWKIFYGATFLKLNSINKINVFEQKNNFSASVEQYQGFLNVDFSLKRNWQLGTSLHFLYLNVNSTNASFDIYWKKPYFFEIKNSLKEFAFNFHLTKDFKFTKHQIFATISNLNEEKQLQIGTNVSFYPFGNQKLTLFSEINFQMAEENFLPQKTSFTFGIETENTNRVIFSQKINAKIWKFIWLEGNFSLGEIKNFTENNGFVIYNSVDKITQKFGFSLYFSLLKSKIDLSLRYNWQELEGEKVNLISFEKYKIDSYLFENQTFIIGLKWNF